MTQLTMPPEVPVAAPQFSQHHLIEQLTADPHPERIATFWETVGSQTPIVEPHPTGLSQVTFLWRGEAEAVFVGLNRVTSTLEHAALISIPGTDLWHRSYLLAPTWRSSYTIMAATAEQLAVLTAQTNKWAMRMIRENGHTDPRNPHTITAHAGVISEIALPGATRNELLKKSAVQNNIKQTELRTPSGRRAWLIEPTTPAPSQGRPLVIMLDGHIWQSHGAAAHIVSQLCHQNDSQQPAALLIEPTPGARVENYGPKSDFPTEIVTEILPWIRSVAAVSPHRTDITISGESLGGLTALRTSFAYPEHVGRIIAQSSSLWADGLAHTVPTATVSNSADHPIEIAPQLHINLTVGSYEQMMLPQHHALAAKLESLGHQVELVEFSGGHDMAWWVQLWAQCMQHGSAQPSHTVNLDLEKI